MPELPEPVLFAISTAPKSPTGTPVVSPKIVPILVVLGSIATVWQSLELYDFGSKTFHPERIAPFVVTLLSTLGVISPGLRKRDQ